MEVCRWCLVELVLHVSAPVPVALPPDHPGNVAERVTALQEVDVKRRRKKAGFEVPSAELSLDLQRRIVVVQSQMWKAAEAKVVITAAAHATLHTPMPQLLLPLSSPLPIILILSTTINFMME